MEEVVKIKASTLNTIWQVLQNAKTNLSYIEFDNLTKMFQKEHEELNPIKELCNEGLSKEEATDE